MVRHRPVLRAAVLIAAALGLLFCAGSLAQWWRIPQAHRDGLELIGVALTLAYLAVLVLPTLVLGLLGRWLILAAILGALAVALASDTLFPWLPWPT